MYFADLHIHSHWSMATSRDCDLPHLDWWARRKGVALVGTGDFTHPAWRAELRSQLTPAGEGVYALRKEYRLDRPAPGGETRFLVTGEVNCVYRRDGRVRRVHHLILLPSLEAGERLSLELERVGRLTADGRPTLRLDSRELLERTLETCPEAQLIPAHIWTPHFSMLGAFSGFNSVEDCFGDLARYVRGVETGLSSDPAMNWRVSALDGYTLLSHSDAHSPAKLGREADLLDTGISYPEVAAAVTAGEGLAGTVEFFPQEGKYFLDGHRDCGVCLTPAEARALGGLCPVCGGKLTVGVAHRAEDLSDRPEGSMPPGRKPFRRLLPLPELIAAAIGRSAASRAAAERYEALLAALGPELEILTRAPLEDVARAAGPAVAGALDCLRRGEADCRPGYDGCYGAVSFPPPEG